MEEATVDHLFMKSKLCGNKRSTLKQLKALLTKLNISSALLLQSLSFFKVRSEGNDTRQARAYRNRKKETLQVMQDPHSQPVRVNR